MNLEFTVTASSNPASPQKKQEILADPGFGQYFSDHMVSIDWTADPAPAGSWQRGQVQAYGPLSLDPATAVFHYGQEIFEGIKAYRHADGSIWTFRPEANAARMQKSAQRLALPQLPTELFIESLKQLMALDASWVPSGQGQAFYLRPFMIATEAYLGVRPTRQAKYMLIGSPVANYFGSLKPVDIWLSSTYSRAGQGGTGTAKCGGNYAAAMLAQVEAEEHGCQQVIFKDPYRQDAIEELGGMNIFFVYGAENRLVTPALNGTILEGITRDSLIQLAKDRSMTVEEAPITLANWREDLAKGAITEIFACGTAAVVSPIGTLKTAEGNIGPAGGQQPGPVTLALREELLGIQSGQLADRHGWLTRLA